jgi:hypothetical protein
MSPRFKAATCRRTPKGASRPTTTGGAFGDWPLASAHGMAFVTHTPTILAQLWDRRDVTATSPVILDITVTSKIRLKAEG